MNDLLDALPHIPTLRQVTDRLNANLRMLSIRLHTSHGRPFLGVGGRARYPGIDANAFLQRHHPTYDTEGAT